MSTKPVNPRTKEFWDAMIARDRGKTTHFQNIASTYQNHRTDGAGKTGVCYLYGIFDRRDAEVMVQIDYGDKDSERQRGYAIFDALYAQRTKIEAAFGAPYYGLRTIVNIGKVGVF